MNKKKILAEIKKIKVCHHRINLGEEITTPGLQDTQALLSQISLPNSLKDLRVLDLGARDGFFSFECEKRGAREVVAIDYVDEKVSGFSLCKKILKSKVKFINANIYSINPKFLGKFDVVLFLGLIYHLRHPALAIDRIYDVLNPKGLLIVESHIIDNALVDSSGNWISLIEDYKNIQIAQFYSNGSLAGDVTNFWAPNQKCLELLLSNSGFEITDSWTIAFRGGVSCRKINIPNNHPRYVDTAMTLNMYNNLEVKKHGDL
jgi:tRNA (mo5U34)-methyltransferase